VTTLQDKIYSVVASASVCMIGLLVYDQIGLKAAIVALIASSIFICVAEAAMWWCE